MKPNCYECIHRQQFENSQLQSCFHPATRRIWGSAPVKHMLLHKMATVDQVKGIKIQYAEVGFKKRQFAWPIKFDPRYLLKCTGFEIKS